MNLKTDIDFDLNSFFQWWGRELTYCLPETLRKKLSDKSASIFLSVEGDIVTFERLVDKQIQKITTLSLNENNKTDYQKLISEEIELENAEYILRLTEEQAIKKIVYLPAAAKENIQQVVGFEMDRLTPFSVDQVYFSVKILEKEQQGKIKVLLVLTPKEVLDGLYFQLKTVNIAPAIVDYSEAANDFEQGVSPYNLLPEEYRPVESKATQIAIWSLSFLAILLTAAVLVFPVWQQGQEVESLRAQLKSLQKDTHLVQSYQLEIDQIIDETKRLIAIKNDSASMIETIDVLSQLLPDETWLTHFKFSNQRLQFQGQSPTASALISVLETSPLFSNARFVSPLTQDKITGMERFQISMDVNSKGDAKDE